MTTVKVLSAQLLVLEQRFDSLVAHVATLEALLPPQLPQRTAAYKTKFFAKKNNDGFVAQAPSPELLARRAEMAAAKQQAIDTGVSVVV